MEEITLLFKYVMLHEGVTDDILMEIFLRLRDRRSEIRCSAVCKHWFSIINSPYHRRQKFKLEYESLPFSIIFRQGRRNTTKPLYEYSSSSSSSSDVDVDTSLGFLPWPNLRLHASTEDLLLVSKEDCEYFIICNPFTRQWIELPQVPLDEDVDPFLYTYYIYAGLVLEPTNNRQQQLHLYRYKVMIIWKADHFTHDYHSITFCSETGKWSSIFRSFTIPHGLSFHPPLVSNGKLHWHSLDHIDSIVHGISTFDPFKNRDHPKYFRFIKFPLGLERENRKSDHEKVRLGLVQGHLRLSQLLVSKTKGLFLKVWELNYDKDMNNDEDHDDNDDNKDDNDDDNNNDNNNDDNNTDDDDNDIDDDDDSDNDDNDDDGMWTLVHDVKVKRWTDTRRFVAAFHPNNGNVLFLLYRRRFIYQYNIEDEKMTKVARLPKGENRYFPLFLLNYVVVMSPLSSRPISALSYL